MTNQESAARIAELQATVEQLEDTLYQCLPFFEDWKDEKGIYKPRTMNFMIRLIRQSLGEQTK